MFRSFCQALRYSPACKTAADVGTAAKNETVKTIKTEALDQIKRPMCIRAHNKAKRRDDFDHLY